MVVNNVNALFAYASGQAASQTGQAAKQDEFTKDSFGQVMSRVNDSISSLKAELANGAAAVNQTVVPADSVQKDQNVQAAQDVTKQTVSEDPGKAGNTMQQENGGRVVKDSDGAADQAVEEVEESAKQLVQDIADEMDVTPEEVEEAMAVLGLTAVELFDVDNLKQLLLQLSGGTDELSLVTNEALYSHLQNLFEAVGESLDGLQETLGLSKEEFNALLEQIGSQNKESGVTDVGSLPEQGLLQDTELSESVGMLQDQLEENLEGMKDYKVSVQRNGETVQVKVTVDDASGNKSVKEEVTDAPAKEILAAQKTREKGAFADNGKGEGNAAGNAFMQTPDKTVEANETPAPVSQGYQSVQTEEIMNQIMEYMKINLKADTQQMELQLHPASLGTVNVQLAAKDGVITAHFTTQNEAVRAVIETQLIQLKAQFEEQGIKVDAVEVTVANHEYGQQFSQEQNEARRKQGKSAKGMRRINLEELDGEEDAAPMEESERIAVEMMQANGNTVDYTV